MTNTYNFYKPMIISNKEQLIRELHPVGQGAFFTETFNVLQPNNIYGSFCIAYDCGSIKNKNINNYIKTCHINFIDALFISHLDNDHCMLTSTKFCNL